MNEHIRRMMKRFQELKVERQPYESVWQDIMDQMAPDLSGYLNTAIKADGSRKDTIIKNKFPERACLGCASGLFAGIASPSRPWAKLTMSNDALDKEPDVRIWLDDEMAGQYEVFHVSNFYQEKFKIDLQLTAIGTACAIMLPDYNDVIRLRTLNVGSFWLGCDDSGRVDTIYRQQYMTAANLVRRFGDTVPQNIRDIVEDKQRTEQSFRVIHVIEPDFYGMAPYRSHKYNGAYFLETGHDEHFLSVGGYELFPALTPRWYVNEGEVYGKYNPGRMALGDCKQYQELVVGFFEAYQKATDPALQGPASVNDKAGDVVTRPGFYNIVDSPGMEAAIKPLYQVNPQLQEIWLALGDMKTQIGQTFYLDLFMAISQRQDKDMTAEEVRALAGERMLMLGPAFGNFDKELLTPAIDLNFHYRDRAGLVQPPPDGVSGERFKAEYISVLAQAQKLQGMNQITQMLGLVGQMARLNPETLDKFDFDAALDDADSMSGAPAGIIRSNDVAAKIRQARAQMQQQQQAALMAQQAAEGAKTLGTTPVNQDNALGRIMEGMGMQ